MCCCKKSRETINIEVWPSMLDSGSFDSIVREAFRIAQVRLERPDVEVQYASSRVEIGDYGTTYLVHKFTATSPGIR